jgi:hypothetical protein
MFFMEAGDNSTNPVSMDADVRAVLTRSFTGHAVAVPATAVEPGVRLTEPVL